MDSTAASDPAPETVRFRAGKKRKAYRQRVDADDDDEAPPPVAASPNPDPQVPSRDDSEQPVPRLGEDDETNVAAALRMRNTRKARLNGVGFTATTASRPDDADPGEQALVVRDPAEPGEGKEKKAVVGGIAKRFAHQTGRVTGLDNKHMMEYVESRLSSRHAPSSGSEPKDDTPQKSMPADFHAARRAAEAQSVMQGLPVEIDLAEVDAAKGQPSQKHSDDPSHNGRNKRQRLGKDGKPWRGRNHRGSDDIKRDQYVEEILRESRLDVYDVPAEPAPASGADQDGAADERLAEEFRRQYFDDVANRQQRRKKTAQAGRPSKEDVLKGPKLGGSRNARAAMRDLLLKKEKEGKK